VSGFRSYTPQLPDDLIHALWARKETTGVPMTALLREAVERFLSEGDRVSRPHPAPESPTHATATQKGE